MAIVPTSVALIDIGTSICPDKCKAWTAATRKAADGISANPIYSITVIYCFGTLVVVGTGRRLACIALVARTARKRAQRVGAAGKEASVCIKLTLVEIGTFGPVSGKSDLAKAAKTAYGISACCVAMATVNLQLALVDR